MIKENIKQNSNKLNENNRIFKSMADNAPIPIVGINYPDLSLNYSNKRFIKDIGFDYSEIRKFKEWHKKIIFVDDDDKKRKGIERQKYIEKMVQGAFVNGVVLRRNIITKSGEVKKFEIDFSVLDKTNLYVFFYDITDNHFAQKLMKELITLMEYRETITVLEYSIVARENTGRR